MSDTFVAPSSNNKGKYTFIAIRTEEKALQSFSNPKLKVLSENLGSSVLEGIESRKSYKNIALVPIYIKDQDMVEGSLNPADGTEQVQSERIRTDYIDIANTNGEYQKIFITNTSDIQAGFPLVYCYDESKKFLKMITPKSGDYDEVNCLYGTVADLDSKTRYIRVTTTEACKYYSRIRIFKGEGEVNELKITNPYERPLQNCEIVCFGDSIFGNYQETPTPNQSIPYLIAKQLDCKTYNVGFGGCNLVDRGDGTDWAQFSMTSLTDALVSGNWTAIDAAANGSTVTSYFKDHLATLKSIDFNKVKIALINYGTNDFASRKLDNLEDPKDRTTIKGAYRYCLNELGKKFPTLSFAICSLYKCYDINAEDETVTEKNSGHEGITRVQFNQALKEVADEFGAIYIDNYNLGVNPYNAPVGFFS